ncbi:MAG: hypothetical protein E6Q88_03365 [Lysobacteraceae bacterium]|nr:MAG: hypothetical protein E6Q88_03365 [Xanthomonadaceae bacterium]
MIRMTAPFALLAFGLLVMLGAFSLFAANALPYQDPSAEMLAHQAAEARKWGAVMMLGFFTTASGGLWLWLRLRARKRAGNTQKAGRAPAG